MKFGRPRIQKSDNWDEVIARWRDKEITAKQAMQELGLKRATFYAMIKNEEK